jgi:hypothetical protein
LIIYPQHFSGENILDQYHDVTGRPLNKGIEAVQKIGKEIGAFFKPDS